MEGQQKWVCKLFLYLVCTLLYLRKVDLRDRSVGQMRELIHPLPATPFVGAGVK